MLDGLIEAGRLTLPEWRRQPLDVVAAKVKERQTVARFHNANTHDAAFILMVDGERAGFVWVSTDLEGIDEKVGWVLGIHVLDRYRKNGYGKLLMKVARDWSAGQGMKEIWLRVGAGNDAARRLYRSDGFAEETVHMSRRL